jgi:hypothetical protein
MIIKSRLNWIAVLVACGACACAAEDTTCLLGQGPPGACEERQRTLEPPEASGSEELAMGSTGASVRVLHEYLTRFGYFPNEELLAEYPGWQAIVAEAPAEPDVFDEQTASALRELQLRLGLPVTGNVDAQTRAAMSADRCGLPDGIRQFEGDPSEKFNHHIFKRTSPVRWKLDDVQGLNNDNFFPSVAACGTECEENARRQRIAQVAANAFGQWTRATGLLFMGTPDPPWDVFIRFRPLEEGVLASAPLPRSGSIGLLVNNTKKWSGDAGPAASDRYDLETILLHEIGHVLGLLHSSVGPVTPGDANRATMYPSGQKGKTDRSLHTDDTVGGSILYEQYTQIGLPTLASDIAVGPDGANDTDSDPDVWVVGTRQAPSGDGFEVRKWIGPGNTYTTHVGGGHGAKAIAVGPNAHVWIVTSAGKIFERSVDGTGGTWVDRGPGCATDIGVGGDFFTPRAWILGCSAVNGGYAVYRLDTSGWTEPNPGAAGTRISVNSLGAPWLVESGGTIWRRPGIQWLQIPSGLGKDIAVGPAVPGSSISYAYVVGNDDQTWGWNEQIERPASDYPDTLDADQLPKAQAQWLLAGGTGVTDIAIDPNGVPWVVRNDGSVWRQK